MLLSAGDKLLTGLDFETSKAKLVTQSQIQLFVTPCTVAHKAPLSVEFSRQEYWSGLPFPSPGDLPKFETSMLQEFLALKGLWKQNVF